MKKDEIKQFLKIKFLKIVNFIVAFFVGLGIVMIAELSFVVPFFPVLFLFHLCCWIGHPLFVKYVLKKEWFVCTKDDYLSIKYLMFPVFLMELPVLVYYWPELVQLAQE